MSLDCIFAYSRRCCADCSCSIGQGERTKAESGFVWRADKGGIATWNASRPARGRRGDCALKLRAILDSGLVQSQRGLSRNERTESRAPAVDKDRDVDGTESCRQVVTGRGTVVR